MRRRLLVLAVFAAALCVAAVPLVSERATDFRAYLEAADALRAGHDPYAGVHPYLYPPLLAILLVPLTLLPAPVAAWTWAAASAAALAAASALLAKGSTRVLVLALLFAPFAATQWNLQANAFVLLVLVLAREELDGGRVLRGGAFLGLSIALKPFALLAAVVLLLQGRWKAVAAAVAVLAATFALVAPFRGLDGVAAAARETGRILSVSWVETYGGNVSLNGSLDRILPDGAGPSRHRAVGFAIAAWTVALAAAAAAGAARAGRSVPPSAAVDAALAATLLGASSSWLHHGTVLFPAVAAVAPGAQVAALALWGAAAAWRVAAAWGPASGALASLAGTAALALVWLLAARRMTRPC